MDINPNSTSNSNDHNNWLAFSLSNNSLFQPLFNTGDGVLVSNDQENGRCIASTAAADHHHHHHFSSVLGVGGPKLEDFLGGSGISSAGDGVAAPPADDVAHPHQFSSDILIYDDSELKNIAATFLRGFSNNNEQTTDETHNQLAVEVELAPLSEPPVKKAVENFSQRTSIYRGVTRHRWTGRYEAHLWDNSCRRQGQSRKGRQVYLGGYDKEEKAARAYDLAALKYWGPTTTTNFPVLDYEKEMDEMKNMTRQEFVASLRRKSSGFSRGASIYRGVTRHHQHGRWQARIGRVAGNKDLYLGTFSTQEEAAEAYDIAAIKFRGLNAVTNFDMSRYDVRSIASSNLPVGGVNSKSKTSSEPLDNNNNSCIDTTHGESNNVNSKDQSSTNSISFPYQNPSMSPTINFALPPMKQDQSSNFWAALGYQNPVTNSAKTTQPSILQGTSTTITPFNMELQTNRFFDGGGNYYQEQVNVTTDHSSPISTNPTNNIAINGNNGTTNGASVLGNGNNGNGNWINNPSLHLLQPSKPNLSVFQRPIFGME